MESNLQTQEAGTYRK